ncbi:MAG: dependent epimerase/dehydratase family protein [Frankiales bacterium]|nr:dependent epimerase/dehydratase family protein [Frankiales bacterium]
MVERRTVVIAGASGLIGQAAARHFASMPDWDVIAVSRRLPPAIDGVTALSVDLAEPGAMERAVADLSDVTHVVYAALHEVPGLMPGWLDAEVIEKNATMLGNFFGAVERVAPNLQHVSLLHGTKAYGLHHPDVRAQGPARIPLRERDPRREHPNFYFVQEKYLRDRQQRSGWGLTVFRPTVVYGDAVGNNMNPIPVIAAYAAMLREEGSPLHYPGRSMAPTIHEAVDADLVARALGWAATSSQARNGTYNLTNGDVFVWRNIWPAIADAMGMKVGEHRPISLVDDLPKRQDQWAALVDKYQLRAPRDLLDFVGYNSLVYTDSVLGNDPQPDGPTLNSTIAARQAGFNDCEDTEDMFSKWFTQLRRDGYLPA